MKIVNEYPPNYELIKFVLNPGKHATFCYGDILYNPSGRELPLDIEHHEEVHSHQQGNEPAAWWNRYITDPDFRLSQEIEAYGAQYAFAKERIEAAADQAFKEGKVLTAGKTKLLRYALETMTFALSGDAYGRLLSYGKAESAIKREAKRKAS